MRCATNGKATGAQKWLYLGHAIHRIPVAKEGQDRTDAALPRLLQNVVQAAEDGFVVNARGDDQGHPGAARAHPKALVIQPTQNNSKHTSVHCMLVVQRSLQCGKPLTRHVHLRIRPRPYDREVRSCDGIEGGVHSPGVLRVTCVLQACDCRTASRHVNAMEVA